MNDKTPWWVPEDQDDNWIRQQTEEEQQIKEELALHQMKEMLKLQKSKE